MKKTVKPGKILALALAIIILLAAGVFIREYTHTGSGKEVVMVNVPKGTSERGIARILKDNGVIKFETVFRLKMKNSRYSGKLMWGEFKLNKDMCLDELIVILAEPQPSKETVNITFPEGFSAEMIAKRCEKNGLVSSEEFLDELENGDFNYDFIKDIPENSDAKYKLQGYLFPSTYTFAKNATARKIIDTMLGEFQKQYDREKGRLPEGMTMHEAIVRASMIEREAKLDNEREMISGVIANRLRINMPLQIDATAVYVVTDGLYGIENVTGAHMKVESPYNTYKCTGLPAGPICNPGIKSIIAAMEPSLHDYLFYHTDETKKDGSHIFSETFAAHTATQ